MKKICVAIMFLLSSLPARADDECVRGVPEPMFGAGQAGVRGHRFKSLSSHEATESVQLASGVKIDMEHGGCEYVVTKFRFSGPDILKQGAARDQAFAAASQALRQLLQFKLNSAFDLQLAARTLADAFKQHPGIQFEEPLMVDGDGADFLQTQVELDAAGPGFVQLMLFKGPL